MSERIDVRYDSEKIKQDADSYIDKFRLRMKDVVDEIFGQAYVNCLPYLETDSWTNYREALRIELEHEYMYSKFKNNWATNFRRAVFVENREEISKLIGEDILKRIKELEDIKQEFDMFRYSPGGDRYQDKVKELDKLAEDLCFYKNEFESCAQSRLVNLDQIREQYKEIEKLAEENKALKAEIEQLLADRAGKIL